MEKIAKIEKLQNNKLYKVVMQNAKLTNIQEKLFLEYLFTKYTSVYMQDRKGRHRIHILFDLKYYIIQDGKKVRKSTVQDYEQLIVRALKDTNFPYYNKSKHFVASVVTGDKSNLKDKDGHSLKEIHPYNKKGLSDKNQENKEIEYKKKKGEK